MPIVSTDGDIRDGSGGSSVSMSSSSELCTCQHAFGRLMGAPVQQTVASFFCETPDLRAIGMLAAENGRGTSCAQATSHRERSL
jgi:hypothetical protein